MCEDRYRAKLIAMWINSQNKGYRDIARLISLEGRTIKNKPTRCHCCGLL